ncbi:hypothetical protein R1sor_000480 [Riccia sorocarpa]|uniref:Reverse transcriptase domain-containing protein n=1 Tax=Riccia sorocarpa TaxID=122646 RepID=A0ABD3GT87_9MARC
MENGGEGSGVRGGWLDNEEKWPKCDGQTVLSACWEAAAASGNSVEIGSSPSRHPNGGDVSGVPGKRSEAEMSEKITWEGDPVERRGAKVVLEGDMSRWAEGVTWPMIESEFEGLRVTEECDEGSDGATRVFELNIKKAATKVGQFRRLALVREVGGLGLKNEQKGEAEKIQAVPGINSMAKENSVPVDADGFQKVAVSQSSGKGGKGGLQGGSRSILMENSNRFNMLEVDPDGDTSVIGESWNADGDKENKKPEDASVLQVGRIGKVNKGKEKADDSMEWAVAFQTRGADKGEGTSKPEAEVAKRGKEVSESEKKEKVAVEGILGRIKSLQSGEQTVHTEVAKDTEVDWELPKTHETEVILGEAEDQVMDSPEVNPFLSTYSVLVANQENAEEGMEVSFEGGHLKPTVSGRGPKKKGKGRQEVEKKRLSKGEVTRGVDEGIYRIKYSIVECEGVGKRDKARAIKSCLCSSLCDVKIIGVQELKVLNLCSTKWLQSIRKEGSVVLDKPIGRRGGTALILDKYVLVEAKGVGGDGRLAWAKCKYGGKQFGVVSIHAPNKRSLRRVFWLKVQEVIQTGEWIILGDFNNVEVTEDSRGPSAMVKGREARVWRSFCSEMGLVDCYFSAASLQGTRFTRFAKRGARYDFSRLDRVYLTHGGHWIDHVKEVRHLGSKTISDHVPLVVKFQMEPGPRRKPESYFKMNAEDLKGPGVMEKVRAAWGRENEVVHDDRRKWMRGWARAKWANESIEALETEGGEVLTETGEILEEIQEFYQVLYTAEFETPEVLEAREEVVNLISKSLTSQESGSVSAIPTKEEIQRVVFSMPANKAPGYDGVTIELLRSCWEVVGEACVKFVQAVWVKKRMLRVDCQGVIELLPKGGDKKALGNWRPISLMNISYKIVAKILANRVRVHLPKLVDSQQSGFVMGRQIADNILSLKIGQEWARWTNQEAIFVKIDFVKAYDRVCHAFLWEVLAKQGFDKNFIDLVKGLTCDGTAKVHVNRAFTQEFKIRPNVMGISRLRIDNEKALVHQLFADDTGIFLAATENNFSELLNILKVYEMASGARVNLAKSLVMFVGMSAVPDWVYRVGCEVVNTGRTFRYLGVRSGVGVQIADCINEVALKITRKVGLWEHHYLSWAARAILIKHVLSQIPSYALLVIGCNEREAAKLERACREFLWGSNPEGKPKRALVAWKKVVRPKKQGGLGILSFVERAIALQIRYVTEILTGKQTEWIWIVLRWIRFQLITGPQVTERKLWSPADALILLDTMRIPEAPTVDRILQGWYKMKKFLWLDKHAGELPETLPIRSLKSIWKIMRLPGQEVWRSVEKDARRLKVVSLGEIRNSQGGVAVEKLLELCSGAQRGTSEYVQVYNWLGILEIVGKKLEEVEGWGWRYKGEVKTGWRQPNQWWTKIIWGTPVSCVALSYRWGRPDDESWEKRWQLLWGGCALNRHKIWVWRILQLGLPTLSKAAKWHVSDGLCPFGCGVFENTEHLFWKCGRIQEHVEWVKKAVMGADAIHVTFIQAMDFALGAHKCQPEVLILLGEYCKIIWNERNKWLFEGKRLEVPVQQIILETRDQLKAAARSLQGRMEKMVCFNSDIFLQGIEELTIQHNRLRGPQRSNLSGPGRESQDRIIEENDRESSSTFSSSSS